MIQLNGIQISDYYEEVTAETNLKNDVSDRAIENNIEKSTLLMARKKRPYNSPRTKKKAKKKKDWWWPF